jgi:dynein heavy chain
MDYINSMPQKDSPTVFGLHPNADLTFRLKESLEMINVLIDTQPKESSGGSGMSKEDEVKLRIEKDLIPMLPSPFLEAETEELLRKMRGKVPGEVGK